MIFKMDIITDYGGEVAYNQSNSYGGFISIQDVSCTGQETSANQCNVSTDITPDCFSPYNIVRINCFSVGKFKYTVFNDRLIHCLQCCGSCITDFFSSSYSL